MTPKQPHKRLGEIIMTPGKYTAQMKDSDIIHHLTVQEDGTIAETHYTAPWCKTHIFDPPRIWDDLQGHLHRYNTIHKEDIP